MDKSKKEDIINACIKEFAEYGYKDANTNRIYKEAGVSKGLIFHYYGSKENLFILAVERCIGKALKDFEQISIDDLNFIDSMIAYNEAKAKFFMQNPAYYKILTQAFFNAPENLKERLAVRYSEIYSLSMRIFSELFEKVKLKKDVSKEAAMQAVMAIMDSIEKKYTPVLLKENEYPKRLAQKVADEFIEQISLILYGISCEN